MSRGLSWRLAVMLALVAVAVAWWRLSGPEQAETTKHADPAPSTAQSAASSPSQAVPTPVSTPDHPDRDAAARAALTTLRTWARPTIGYDQWWSALEPLLQPSARELYEYTDPKQIPALRILSRPVEDRSHPDADAATFYVKTNHGRFGVDVARDSATGPWRALAIIFPGEPSTRQ